jgi:hypothetical protein
MGTTYSLPNYTGMLYALTPYDTPLLTACGGLSGGGQTASTEFEWEFYDLRSAAQNVQLEGAAAPTAQERVRSNVTNLTQIHQEKVSVSYSKQAAVGQKAGTNNALPNPIGNELDWQVSQMLKQMARDVEYSFINGTYQKPTDNTTTRKTKGLLSAIATNVSTGADLSGGSQASVTVVATTGVWTTAAAHNLAVGDTVIFGAITTTTGVTAGVQYVVQTVPSTTTFTVGLTKTGAPLTLVGNGSAATVTRAIGAGVDNVDTLLQSVYDNGGIGEQGTATLIVNSAQKRRLTKAYASSYGMFHETSRNVGGLDLDTIETDFGTLNVMLDRFVPQDTVIVCSMEQLQPVFLEVPGKGHFFAEPLAKTGASDEVQLYGEVGLAFGNEKAHGKFTGLATA